LNFYGGIAAVLSVSGFKQEGSFFDECENEDEAIDGGPQNVSALTSLLCNIVGRCPLAYSLGYRHAIAFDIAFSSIQLGCRC